MGSRKCTFAECKANECEDLRGPNYIGLLHIHGRACSVLCALDSMRDGMFMTAPVLFGRWPIWKRSKLVNIRCAELATWSCNSLQNWWPIEADLQKQYYQWANSKGGLSAWQSSKESEYSANPLSFFKVPLFKNAMPINLFPRPSFPRFFARGCRPLLLEGLLPAS